MKIAKSSNALVSFTAMLASATFVACLLLWAQQGNLKQKNDQLAKQIVQLAMVEEPDKMEWTENSSPGFHRFTTNTLGTFEYPAGWGEPSSTTTRFRNSLWHGEGWILRFQGGLLSMPWMEAYIHDPSINIEYPFDPTLSPEADTALLASAAFAAGNSSSQACEAYKKLHKLPDSCQSLSDSAFFIPNREHGEEEIWFIDPPTRPNNDFSRGLPYEGVILHSGSEYPVEVRALVAKLKALPPLGS